MRGASSRIAMLLVMLVVPLGLAVASQALADRPGAPRIERPVVVLRPVDSEDTTPSPAAPSPSPAEQSDGPLVVDPQVPTGTDEDDDEDGDDEDEQDDEDDQGADR